MTLISRPPHKRYLLHNVDNSSYLSFVNKYANAKRIGVKATLALVTGSGYYDLGKEIVKGAVVSWGKRKVAASIISVSTYFCCPLVPFITNSTKIIKIANITHTCLAYCFELVEDCSGIAWIPFDIALCGQPIPIGENGRYVLMGGDHRILPFLED